MWKTSKTKPKHGQRVIVAHHNGQDASVGVYDNDDGEVNTNGGWVDWEDVVWWHAFPDEETPVVADYTVRNAVADYMATGGGCCLGCWEENESIERRLGELLEVPFDR